MFAVNKKLFKASREGFMGKKRLVFSRINMNICDKKQDSEFYCLKSADSLCDCTPYLMPFYVIRQKTGDKEG